MGNIDPNSIVVDFSAAAQYEPHSGLVRDHFTHDGTFLLKLTGRDLDKNDKGNIVVELRFEAVDDDNKGRKTFRSIPATGVDKNGKPNILQLIDFVAKTRGLSTEQARSLAGYGAQAPLAKVLDQLLPPNTEITVGASIETSYYKGRAGSDIKFFVPRSEWESATKSGSARRPHAAKPAEQAVGVSPAGFMPTMGGVPGTAPGIVPSGIPGMPAVAAPAVAAPAAQPSAPAMNGMPAIPGLPAFPGALGQIAPQA